VSRYCLNYLLWRSLYRPHCSAKPFAGIQARPDTDRTCHMAAECVSEIYLMSRRKTWAPTNHASNIDYHNVAQHKAWSYESGLHKIDVVWLEGSIVGMTPSVYHSWMTRSGLRYDGAPTKAYKTRAASFGLAPLWFRSLFAGFRVPDYRVFSLARSLTLLSLDSPKT